MAAPPPRDPCTNDNECCSDYRCRAGECQRGICGTAGQACDSEADCCTAAQGGKEYFCNAYGTCDIGRPYDMPGSPPDPCTTDANCDGGSVCRGAFCHWPAPPTGACCGHDLARCASDADCCSGSCDESFGSCNWAQEYGQCLDDSDCSSRVFGQWDGTVCGGNPTVGPFRCCPVPGDACLSDADCCEVGLVQGAVRRVEHVRALLPRGRVVVLGRRPVLHRHVLVPLRRRLPRGHLLRLPVAEDVPVRVGRRLLRQSGVQRRVRAGTVRGTRTASCGAAGRRASPRAATRPRAATGTRGRPARELPVTMARPPASEPLQDSMRR